MSKEIRDNLAKVLSEKGIRINIEFLYYKKELDETEGRNVYSVEVTKE